MEISAFDRIISIDNFEYFGEVNKHEHCRFTCSVQPADVDSYLSKVDSECKFSDADFEFNGHITEIAVIPDISGPVLEVITEGATREYDRECFYRVFQDQNKKFSDVLTMLSSMKNVKNTVSNEDKIPDILVQDGITDWQFSLYLANALGEFIFPGANTFISNKGDDKGTLEENNLITYRYANTVSGATLLCRIPKNFNLGDVVSFKGHKLFLYQKKYFLEHEKYYFEYLFKEVQDLKEKVTIKNNATLEAKVINNKDDSNFAKLQLSFENDKYKDPMQDKPLWIEAECFYTSKDNGAIFIPAKDDKVLVHIYNGKAYVLGSLRTEAYNKKIVTNVDNQYLILDENTYVKFNNEKPNKNTTIIIKKGKHRIELGEEKFSFRNGNDIVIDITPKSMCMQIVNTKMKFTDDTLIETKNMSIDIKNTTSVASSKLNMEGSSNVSMKGGSIDIEGTSVGIK